MRNYLPKSILVIVAMGVLLSVMPAAAQQDIVDRTMEACKADIESYCSQVTPGDGRLLACFVAHEDKISGQCSYSLYQAMAEFDAFVNALAYVASSCEADIVKHCGRGRDG